MTSRRLAKASWSVSDVRVHRFTFARLKYGNVSVTFMEGVSRRLELSAIFRTEEIFFTLFAVTRQLEYFF